MDTKQEQEKKPRIYLDSLGNKVADSTLPRSHTLRQLDTCSWIYDKFAKIQMPPKIMFGYKSEGIHSLKGDWKIFNDQGYAQMTGVAGYEVNPATNRLGKVSNIIKDDPAMKTLRGIDFDPSCQRSITPSGMANLWQGFEFRPREGTDKCQRYLDFCKEIICDNDRKNFDFLINLLAWAIQNPGRNVPAITVLKSGQGTGKDTFVEIFGALWGKAYLETKNPKSIVGDFNSMMKAKKVLYANEAFFAGDRAASNRLKFVTDPKICINEKHIPEYSIKNCIMLFMASNHDSAINAEATDRRYFVLEVSEREMGNNEYFLRIKEDMKNGGYEQLMGFLKSKDLTGFDPYRVPKTEGLKNEQEMFIERSLNTECYITECRERGQIFFKGGWCDESDDENKFIPFVDLYEGYLDWFQERAKTNKLARRPDSKKAFSQRFKKLTNAIYDQHGERRARGFFLPRRWLSG